MSYLDRKIKSVTRPKVRHSQPKQEDPRFWALKNVTSSLSKYGYETSFANISLAFSQYNSSHQSISLLCNLAKEKKSFMSPEPEYGFKPNDALTSAAIEALTQCGFPVNSHNVDLILRPYIYNFYKQNEVDEYILKNGDKWGLKKSSRSIKYQPWEAE